MAKSGMKNNVRYGMTAYVDKMLRKIDKRKKSGKSHEDDNKVNNHLSHVADDGARTWSF